MLVHLKSEIFVGVLINFPFQRYWVSNKKYRKDYDYHLPLRERATTATTIDVAIAERTITMLGAIQKKMP